MDTHIEYCANIDQEVVLDARYLIRNIGGKKVKLLIGVFCSVGSVAKCKECDDCKIIDRISSR